MFRLAICDDDLHSLQMLFTFIQRHYAEHFMAKCYGHADELRADLNAEQFIPDVVVMDIEFGTDDGVALAQEINQKHTAVQFIFITSYNERYSQHIFLHQVNLVGYVVKPANEDILRTNLDHALERAEKEQQEVLLIANKNGVRALPQNKIIYIESIGHLLYVHLPHETPSYTGRLDEVEKQLPNTFVRVHKSFLLNLRFMKGICGKDALLQNSQIIPMSRNYFEKVRTAYYLYWGAQL